MEISYHFSAAVEKAIEDEKRRLLHWRKLGLITSDQVREMHESFLARHLYAARQEDNPDRAVAVKCDGCDMVHIMPVSVKVLNCKCSPFVDRLTAVRRVAFS